MHSTMNVRDVYSTDVCNVGWINQNFDVDYATMIHNRKSLSRRRTMTMSHLAVSYMRMNFDTRTTVNPDWKQRRTFLLSAACKLVHSSKATWFDEFCWIRNHMVYKNFLVHSSVSLTDDEELADNIHMERILLHYQLFLQITIHL